MKREFWLVELDQYGLDKLIDGAHSERSGAEKALTLMRRLTPYLLVGRRFAIAEVILTEPVGEQGHGPLNEEAIETLNANNPMMSRR